MRRGRRRSLLILVVALVVAAVLTDRASRAPYGTGRLVSLTYAIAGVLAFATLLSGGVPKTHRRDGRQPLLGPALSGVGLFLVFAVLAWVATLLPPVHHGIATALRHSRAEDRVTMSLATVVSAFAEEAFYRGALFERVRLPILTTTVAHAVVVMPAGNVALVLAAIGLGVALGMSRRTSGGWWAPAVTHAVWGLLVLAWLPT